MAAKEGEANYFISGAASEKTSVKLIPKSKMAASEFGFMVFFLKSEELGRQAINDEGKVIYTFSQKNGFEK